MTLCDEELMQQVGLGDAQAFEVLYGRYRRRLYNFILRYTQDGALAEDLFQDSFLQLLRAAPRWRPEARLCTWLYRIALNRCIDAGRKRHPESLDAEALDQVPDPAPDLQTGQETREALERVKGGVAALPPEQRAVLLLRVYEGLSEQEVAAIVGCPAGTVKSRLHHALRRVREQVGVDGERPGL